MGVQVVAVAAMSVVVVMSVAAGYYAGVGNAQSETPSTTLSFNLPGTSSSTVQGNSSLSFETSTLYTTMYITTTVTNSGAVYTLTVTDYYANGTRTLVTTTTAFANANGTTVYVTSISTITANSTVTVTPSSAPVHSKKSHPPHS